MPVTAAVRYVRAAVFAAVCVALSAAGHAVMSGPAVPGWALAAAAVTVFVCAGLAAGRERSLPVIAGGVLACQGGLHVFFSWAQGIAASAQAPGKAAAWADLLLCGHMGPAGSVPLPVGSMRQVVRAAGMDWNRPPVHPPAGGPARGGSPADAMHSMAGMHSMPAMQHAGVGMLAAHLLAGLVCGWWLHRGERALFALLAALAAAADRSLHRLLHLLLVGVTVPVAHVGPRRVRRPAAAEQPHLAVVRHAVIRRGPPLSFSY
ncbi:hypothetical protein GCM10010211_45530 [Streptomyces albospinus]|uniref:Integral membrane protein n=1 Tax=Streptomyces albospinus TaxID=285515 RepID=A0ABQ2VBV5_9ACTN|nr:hypothetical protein [Streptomyces albospinus]GGU74562.1 hypothetical protein GCM10010211_45530 [Streptomyces albospinus]